MVITCSIVRAILHIYNSGRKFSYSILAWWAWFFFRIILWFKIVQPDLNSFYICAILGVRRLLLGFEIFNVSLVSINYAIQLGNQFGILLSWSLLKLFHLILNFLDAFVCHAPCRLLSASNIFILITFPLSLLNKLLDIFLMIFIILSNFSA